MGLDGIYPIYFKSCSFIVSKIFWIIFNKSFFYFPLILKAMFCQTNSKNFQSDFNTTLQTCLPYLLPICIQNVMPKIFENIIFCTLSFLCKNIIINEQYGFVETRSITINFLEYHYYLTKLNRKKIASRCHLHQFLQGIWYSQSFNTYFQTTSPRYTRPTCLANEFHHEQKTVVNAYSKTSVYSGVPQGSHLDPYSLLCSLMTYLKRFSFVNI